MPNSRQSTGASRVPGGTAQSPAAHTGHEPAPNVSPPAAAPAALDCVCTDVFVFEETWAPGCPGGSGDVVGASMMLIGPLRLVSL